MSLPATGGARIHGDERHNALTISAASNEFSDDSWIPLAGGASTEWIDGQIFTVTADDAGNVYVGGSFHSINGIPANNVAKWNGETWLPLGAGISGIDAGVHALELSEGILYAGGRFTTAGYAPARNVAKWDGAEWSALDSGVNGPVYALTSSGNTVYAGGLFTSAGSLPAANIARWDGSGWSALGSGIGVGSATNRGVHALLVSDGNLYAGGDFSSAGGVTTPNIARWDGSGWHALGAGLSTWWYGVRALAVYDGDLYAGGGFDIRRWDGFEWLRVGSGFWDPVARLAAFDNRLYVGTAPDPTVGPNVSIFEWDGSQWSTDGSQYEGIMSLATSDVSLYVAAHQQNSGRLLELTQEGWQTLGIAGFQGTVHALAVLDDSLYAGGDFRRIDGHSINHLGRWHAGGWSPAGIVSPVFGLVASAEGLYLNDRIHSSNRVRLWDRSTWSTLRSSNRPVSAIAHGENALYIAERHSDGPHSILRWNGSQWNQVGGDVNDTVHAIAFHEGVLYIAGDFSSAGGTVANRIAQWTGETWTGLQEGTNGPVYALASADDRLYAAGAFTSAGGIDARHVAVWTGDTWAPLDSGTGGPVYSLATSEHRLFAGGVLTSAGGTAASNIAQWNGSAWSPLGAGTNGPVYALTVSGNYLFTGGNFTTAGNQPSGFVAKALLVQTPTPVLRIDRLTGAGSVILRIEDQPGRSFLIETTTDLAGNWTPLGHAAEISPGIYELTDPEAGNLPRRFYRAVE